MLRMYSWRCFVCLRLRSGGYFGRVNLRTGEKEDFTLGHLLAFKPGYADRQVLYSPPTLHACAVFLTGTSHSHRRCSCCKKAN